MKSVLISIKPKWCELIVKGEKTVEVRKTRPKIETPFKCYIYCSHGYYRTPKERKKSGDFWIGKPINDVSQGRYWGNGKVVGEFVCDKITIIEKTSSGLWTAGEPNGDCSKIIKKQCCHRKEYTIMRVKTDIFIFGIYPT